MIVAIQRIFLAIGKEGCYFLSLIWLAETIKGRRWDVVGEFFDMIEKRIVAPDGFILDASRVFTMLMDERWECVKAGPGHPLPLDYKLDASKG